jgi:hypothetical protein
MIMSCFIKFIEKIIKMMLAQSILFICLLFIPSSIVFAQTSSYTAYRTSFPLVTSCPTTQYFDIALMQCSACPANAHQKSTGKFLMIKII